MGDNEKKTLWKINDCLELLKSRVSEKFVSSSVSTLEQKLKKEIAFVADKDLERLEKAFKELG